MRLRESFRQFGKNQRGAVAVEFAIIGTLCTVLIFVMIQMGMVFYSYHVMQTGARDGARRLAMDPEMNAANPGVAQDCASTAFDAANPAQNSVEAYTCSIMQLFADAEVAACIIEDVPNVRYDAEVVVTADMGEVGMFDFFGVANGVEITASAVVRVEVEKDDLRDENDVLIPLCSTSLLS